MDTRITDAISKHRTRAQAIIDRGEREKLCDARVEIIKQITQSPTSMCDWLEENMGEVERESLLLAGLYLLLIEHYKQPVNSLPVRLFRFVAEEVGAVIDAVAQKAVE